MELPDSYEALYRRANEAVSRGDLDEAITRMKRLMDRLLSLPPHILERKIDEAVKAIRGYQQFTRWARPYCRILPYSYWLRLRRYPMPDEAVEALRPYFVTEEAASPA